MTLHRPPRRRDNEAHLIPLINIVFLLLIFFLLTARLHPPEPFSVEPPASASANPVEPEELTVLIAADGRLAVEGQETDAAAVQERLSGHDSIRITLKADARLNAHRLIEVMELLRRAGTEKFILLTVQGDG